MSQLKIFFSQHSHPDRLIHPNHHTFVNCLDWGCKEDISDQSCAAGQYNDRLLEVGTEDIIVDAVFGVCEPSYSLNFDGIDDYVTMGDPVGLDVGNTDFTIKIVFKMIS